MGLGKNIFEKSGSEVDILIYGNLGYDWWDGVDNSASAFVRAFKELEAKYQRINIHINSAGGAIYEGLPVYNAIRQSKADTHCYIDGFAGSMAGIIALAGRQVHACKNSILHLHSPWMYAQGNAYDLRAAADDLDVFENALAENLSERTGKTASEAKGLWFDGKDHFIGSPDMLALKFIDVIEEGEAEFPKGVKPADIVDLQGIMAAYRGFEPSRRAGAGRGEAGVMDALLTRLERIFMKTNKTNEDMDTKKLLAALELGQSADEAAVLAAIADIKAKHQGAADALAAQKAAFEEAQEISGDLAREIEDLKAQNQALLAGAAAKGAAAAPPQEPIATPADSVAAALEGKTGKEFLAAVRSIA